MFTCQLESERGDPWHLGHRNLADCQKSEQKLCLHYGIMALRTCSAIVSQNSQLQAGWEILCLRATNGRWPRVGASFGLRLANAISEYG